MGGVKRRSAIYMPVVDNDEWAGCDWPKITKSDMLIIYKKEQDLNQSCWFSICSADGSYPELYPAHYLPSPFKEHLHSFDTNMAPSGKHNNPLFLTSFFFSPTEINDKPGAYIHTKGTSPACSEFDAFFQKNNIASNFSQTWYNFRKRFVEAGCWDRYEWVIWEWKHDGVLWPVISLVLWMVERQMGGDVIIWLCEMVGTEHWWVTEGVSEGYHYKRMMVVCGYNRVQSTWSWSNIVYVSVTRFARPYLTSFLIFLFVFQEKLAKIRMLYFYPARYSWISCTCM